MIFGNLNSFGLAKNLHLTKKADTASNVDTSSASTTNTSATATTNNDLVANKNRFNIVNSNNDETTKIKSDIQILEKNKVEIEAKISKLKNHSISNFVKKLVLKQELSSVNSEIATLNTKLTSLENQSTTNTTTTGGGLAEQQQAKIEDKTSPITNTGDTAITSSTNTTISDLAANKNRFNIFNSAINEDIVSIKSKIQVLENEKLSTEVAISKLNPSINIDDDVKQSIFERILKSINSDLATLNSKLALLEKQSTTSEA